MPDPIDGKSRNFAFASSASSLDHPDRVGIKRSGACPEDWELLKMYRQRDVCGGPGWDAKQQFLIPAADAVVKDNNLPRILADLQDGFGHSIDLIDAQIRA